MHIFQQLRHTKLWKKVPKLNMKLRFKKLNTKLNKKLNTKQAEESIDKLTNDTTESGRFDQLHEPLLDHHSPPTVLYELYILGFVLSLLASSELLL